jgi:hypothetical protein
LTLAFCLGLLVIDLSGTARGEVARVWLFLVPWALLISVQALGTQAFSKNPISGPTLAIVVLLALQLFAAAVSLRVIHTRYKDRPRLAPTVEALPAQAQPVSARFDEGIELVGYRVETLPEPSPAISLTLYWRTDTRIGWPWTVFRHVVADGQLVGQYDSHPAQNTWPTTCWQPGEIVVDSQMISLDVHQSFDRPVLSVVEGLKTSLDEATLSVGLYDAETGRRLTVVGEWASPEGNTVEILLAP